jgi:hypothetical protein
MSEPYFGPGTTPERVAEAIEKAQESRDRSGKRRPTTSEREAFFSKMAEEVKRAGGDP